MQQGLVGVVMATGEYSGSVGSAGYVVLGELGRSLQ